MKKIIFNADDLGNSKALNEGIRRGVLTGVLNSTSLMATGPEFEDAVFNVLPEIQNVKLGVHLNIIEGQSLTNPSSLCGKEGKFNKSFVDIQNLSKKPEVMDEIEKEFRAQIEKILQYTNPVHLDSHVHTHAITPIFELTCKLAQEYGIPRVRTQHEVPYIVTNVMKMLNIKYPVNLIKHALLNSYTKVNKPILEQYGLKTNDYFVGVTFTGYMDEDTVWYGLLEINDSDCVAEVLIHPHYYAEGEKVLSKNNFREFQITQNAVIKRKLEESGWVY